MPGTNIEQVDFVLTEALSAQLLLQSGDDALLLANTLVGQRHAPLRRLPLLLRVADLPRKKAK